ncbi:sugar phosphate nucleotidyltransferase [Helicobacter saguini]|nr:sugar phosphate nucleotidyltransferase [Helicobacter saguini]MWV62787.1 NTP transferase domain-containing protein [Helicobacter saguini]MWV68893.1 NTP transferase domain-containing protein [Helicobacter saguini]MWV71553.1 NTP transferase domain-containing protein [Helicobacter saguini]
MLKQIIIQAGGKGTRLEGLTRNKPKCIVPYDNLPIIFHLFRKFKGARFTIIADYKIDVLEKYLQIFAENVDYRILKPRGEGTISGIKDAISSFKNDESFMIIWCDLILSESFKLPNELDSKVIESKTPVVDKLDSKETRYTKNYIGISKSFECRWSFEAGIFAEKPSFRHGVAGLFIFSNKKILKNIPTSGALVEWLQHQNIEFNELSLESCKEIGTLLAYTKCNPISLTRPFNKIEFRDKRAIKSPLDTQGREIAKKEVAWYKFVSKQGFADIPHIYKYEPLEMKQINGKNIFEYECLLDSQKREILSQIIATLHTLTPPRKAVKSDCIETYITKTFSRLEKVKELIPFAKNEFIKINHRYYKNILFCKDTLCDLIEKHLPSAFVVIHGDCTFSNILFDSFNMKCVLIDPRGYFGKSDIYGDKDYDFAKLYYSIVGNYDTFNRKKFSLLIESNSIELAIKTNGWENME